MARTRTTANREQSAPRAVLWDLDGTLADSSEYHWRSWCDALAQEGLQITRADFLASFGQRNDAILAKWLGAKDDPRIQRIGEAKEQSYRDMITADGLAPLPGAAAWVEALHEAGWLQAIASSAPRLNVEVMRRVLGFETLIETFVGAEDVQHGKPDPEVFLAAAARLNVPARRCVVVEDAAAGVTAARRAGMHCIGVGDRALADADIIVASLADLPADAFEMLVSANAPIR